MKDFDSERKARTRSEEERTFKLGGETFVVKTGLHPSALERYDALSPDTPAHETMEIVDDLIRAMIENRDGAHDRYMEVRDNRDDVVTLDDLQELVQWMLEVQTRRPTGQPDASSRTGPTPRPSTPLTAVSSGTESPEASTA